MVFDLRDNGNLAKYIYGPSQLIPDHVDENVERDRIDALEEAIGDDSTVFCLNSPRPSRGVAQVVIHSQAASQGGWSCQCPSWDMGLC